MVGGGEGREDGEHGKVADGAEYKGLNDNDPTVVLQKVLDLGDGRGEVEGGEDRRGDGDAADHSARVGVAQNSGGEGDEAGGEDGGQDYCHSGGGLGSHGLGIDGREVSDDEIGECKHSDCDEVELVLGHTEEKSDDDLQGLLEAWGLSEEVEDVRGKNSRQRDQPFVSALEESVGESSEENTS